MPRAVNLDDTYTVKKLIMRTIGKIEKGEITAAQGNACIAGYRAILYGTQIDNTERRLVVDERLADNMDVMRDYLEGRVSLPALIDAIGEEGNINEYGKQESGESPTGTKDET